MEVFRMTLRFERPRRSTRSPATGSFKFPVLLDGRQQCSRWTPEIGLCRAPWVLKVNGRPV
eukprot:scaffold23000_cov63-Phaeocystis_antarctica.AAC.3